MRLEQVLLVAALLWGALAPPAAAVDLSGSLRLWTGTTSAAGLESDEEDGAFNLTLDQDLTPWLTLFGSFRARHFRTRFDSGPVFERDSEQPEIGLSYGRSDLNARLYFSDRAVRTSDESQDLNVRTFLASLDWRPRRGPGIGVRFQDSTSTADAALFGRDTGSRNLNVRADYSRATWSARYSFDLAEIDNEGTGLELEQTQHEVRGGYSDSFWGDRWSVALDARLADVSQTQDARTGAEVSLPVPIAQGLFAIDSTPALAELEPAPLLIDGNTTQPAAVGAEIGGANTFRNIGMDLGITRTISAIEVTVDGPSGPVIWQVWHSPDNASWLRTTSATTVFDAGLLRYTIRFPETAARYFKAVNVSVNPVLEVAVSEVRALLRTRQLERSEGSGSEYWLNLQSSLSPADWIELSVGARVRRDRDLVATDLRRSYDERGLSALLRLDLRRDLELRLGYRSSELDENLEPAVERREDVTSVVLDWRPRQTVGVLLTAQEREETDGGLLISSSDSLTLQAVTRIFPDLLLNSTIGLADTFNPFFSFSQETRFFVGTIEARPTDRWIVGATLSRYEYDSEGDIVVTSRTAARLNAVWLATAFLSLNGEVVEAKDDLGDTTTWRGGAQWAPGPKLSLGANYYDTSSSLGTGTANLSLDASYRLNRWLQAWLALNEAESSVAFQEPVTTEALRVGINTIF